MTPPQTVPFVKTVPDLAEMTRGALNVLDNNPKGFFLMIEGGAVDWANHNNQGGRMIEEMTDFSQSVAAVIAWVEANSNWNETLLIVTGDHETGYLWGPNSGKPATFNPIIDNGKNHMPGMQYYATKHCNSVIPFFAKGQGSELFPAEATHKDPVRGPYINNIDVAKTIFQLYLKTGK
jgi:alkaline phosphatase